MLSKLLSLSNKGIILLYISIILIITILQQEFVMIPQLHIMPVVDESIRPKIIENYYKYRWLLFVVPPVVIILRIFLVSVCLEVGTIIDDKQILRFRECWNVAVKADIVKILISIGSFVLVFVYGAEKATTIISYSSFVCLLDSKMTESWILVAMNSINIFEVLYWLVLAWVFSIQSSMTYGKSLKFILSTYCVGYFMLIILMMFLVLYLS